MNSLADPFVGSHDDAQMFGDDDLGTPFAARGLGRVAGSARYATDAGDDAAADVHAASGAADDPVRLYLREIGRVRLLNSQEEIGYASAIRAGERAVAEARAWMAGRIALHRFNLAGAGALRDAARAWAQPLGLA